MPRESLAKLNAARVQRGFLVGVSGKQWESAIYVFNAGFTDPTMVLEVWFEFLSTARARGHPKLGFGYPSRAVAAL
jgi:hypothetical protein